MPDSCFGPSRTNKNGPSVIRQLPVCGEERPQGTRGHWRNLLLLSWRNGRTVVGVRREVADLDIMVLFPDADESSIQQALIALQPDNFFLRRPRARNATFMKLYYRIPRTPHSIKVDLLLSTTPSLEIPRSLRPSHFIYHNQLPVAPLYFVLYHKLLGWEDRVNSPEHWKQLKAGEVDYADIIGLCSITYREGLRPLSKAHMGRLYLDNFESRADEFVARYGRDARAWFRRLDFPV